MNKVLENKIFISTRPPGRTDELAGYINEMGGRVLEMPMIEIQQRKIDHSVKNKIFPLSHYQWIIFTSPNGIRYFFHLLKEEFGQVQLPRSLKLATIGKHTAKQLEAYNLKADFINSGNTSNDFANALEKEFGNANPRVLWPTGNLSRSVLKDNLKHKADIEVVYVYNTVKPEAVDQTILDQVMNDQYDLIIFTSPSGFDNLKNLIDDESVTNKLRIASIGHTTTTAIEQQGVIPVVTARMSDAKGIADSICEYYIK
ncbi:MAG: hypothetical protein GVY19_00680 [Bacteroidetes bacterium]|jgi:uroporphyrinogen-III synthase|nr:hypothetical protein [Bacteroidota bacterium]